MANLIGRYELTVDPGRPDVPSTMPQNRWLEGSDGKDAQISISIQVFRSEADLADTIRKLESLLSQMGIAR